MPKTDPATDNSFQVCDCCNQQFQRRGFASHHAACLKKADQRRKDAIFDAKKRDLAAQKQLKEETPPKPRMAKPWEDPGLRGKKKMSRSSSREHSVNAARHAPPATAPTSSSHSAQARDPANDPRKDDIRRDFHENSGRPSEFTMSEDYRKNTHNPLNTHNPTPETSDAPWKPFGSYSEFEFAEVALEAALNRKQIDKLLKLTQRCIRGEDDFGLQSHNDLTSVWKDAAAMVSPVRSI